MNYVEMNGFASKKMLITYLGRYREEVPKADAFNVFADISLKDKSNAWDLIPDKKLPSDFVSFADNKMCRHNTSNIKIEWNCNRQNNT